VVSPLDHGARIYRAPGRREYVLPAPFSICIRILPLQGEREVDPAKAFFKISLVPYLDAGKMISKRLDQTLRQSSHAVLLALAVADRELGAFEVHVFHAQAQALQQPEAAAVSDARHEPHGSFELRQESLHFLLSKYHGEVLRPLGPLDILQPRERNFQDV